MLGQQVMCRAAGQAFELPPDHTGEKVQCPLCGGEHPAPPIIPPPVKRLPIAAGPPPVVRFLRGTTIALTLLCGVALGLLAGLAIAAATMPAEHEFRERIAELEAEGLDQRRQLDAEKAASAAQEKAWRAAIGRCGEELDRAATQWDAALRERDEAREQAADTLAKLKAAEQARKDDNAAWQRTFNREIRGRGRSK